MQAYLCGFASDFPKFVASFLEEEWTLSRSFREETITDLWAGALLGAAGYGVSVDFPDEAATGADLELWFVSKRLERSLSFLVQAKRAHCHRQAPRKGQRCRTKNLDRHAYRHLDHPGGKLRSRGDQVRTVVSQVDRNGHPIYPLYAFYNPSHAWEPASKAEGVVLADGHAVARIVEEGLKPGSPTSMTYKQVRSLQDQFIPFEKLFCVHDDTAFQNFVRRAQGDSTRFLLSLSSGGTDVLFIPDPDAIAQQMRDCIVDRRKPEEDSPLPEVREGVPDDIKALMEGERGFRHDGFEARPRWRVVMRASAETD